MGTGSDNWFDSACRISRPDLAPLAWGVVRAGSFSFALEPVQSEPQSTRVQTSVEF